MLTWLTAVAFAGNLYVNDVHVNPTDLQGMTLESVDVSIDAQGNIRIAAPGYKIEVVSPAPAPAYGQAQQPAYGQAQQPAYGQAQQPAYGQAQQPAYGQPQQPAYTGTAATYGAPPSAPVDPGVPQARWWLVTEDNGSSGHSVEILINGRVAEVVRSGDPQRIIDIGRHLRLGNNDIQIRSNSTGGGGGSLYVYLGTGSDRSGTVVMDEPAVQYGLGASRTGPFERSYTLQVQ